MTKRIFPAVIILLAAVVAVARGETYRWTDARGGVHFSDDVGKIPSRYRSGAVRVEEKSVNTLPSEEAAGAEGIRGDDGERTTGEEETKGRSPKSASPVRSEHRSHRHGKHGAKGARMPPTPARRAQDEAEEKIRKDRQAVEDAQLPARRAQERAEEQIRRAREKTFGH